ncbi:DUF2244 domain-containing protein [Roseomonas sp. CCTCC AB2023176]|uniref:DUF2244 domain-containing protein n=1 Tax=Roseomonas sp. CCTCC AB2023176 TaxID=3342640 RepID=UPI0035DF4FDF
MSACDTSVRFQAETSPRQSWDPRGFRVVTGLLLIGSVATTTVFWIMGAWPVAGFMGVEVVGVLALMLAHRRWSSRARERITLHDDALRVEREDGRGQREVASLDAYWTKVALHARPGRISELRLTSRGRSIEVGRFLPEVEKLRLAEALSAALRDLRSPVFDNPQLRATPAT